MISKPIVPLVVLIPILSVCLVLYMVSVIRNKSGILNKILKAARIIVILALAFTINLRPMTKKYNIDVELKNIDVLFVVDTTISMWAEDYNESTKRMDDVKRDCRYIMESLAGSNFALIRFDNRAQILAPFTQDSKNVSDAFSTITTPSKYYATGTSLNVAYDAMEEMLKDRSGGIVPMDLTPILHQDVQMLRTYFEKDIAQYGIQITFDIPQHDIQLNGNADQLSKTFTNILGNAVYAVVKKAGKLQNQGAYHPEITLHASVTGKQVTLKFHDNGIGIEETIIGKIFDPFFTTKTTGEAAGVGLYLCHEIVQNHGGTITVESEKDQYTEFTITLPTL